jgi:hypothetical protein
VPDAGIQSVDGLPRGERLIDHSPARLDPRARVRVELDRGPAHDLQQFFNLERFFADRYRIHIFLPEFTNSFSGMEPAFSVEEPNRREAMESTSDLERLIADLEEAIAFTNCAGRVRITNG